MSILLTITDEDNPVEFLRKFYYFNGIDTEFVTSNDVTAEFLLKYNEYEKEWLKKHNVNNFFFCFWRAPMRYLKWLETQGVAMSTDSFSQDARIFHYMVRDRDTGNISIREWSNSDVFANDGGLIRGGRIDPVQLNVVGALIDGSEHSVFSRQRKNLTLSILLADEADVQINIWQAWERRYDAYYYPTNCHSFTQWRNAVNDGEPISTDSLARFYSSQVCEIPRECRSRAEFVNAAIAVNCDAVLKSDVWYERRGDSWSEIVEWANFVNEALQNACPDSWIYALEY